MLIEAKRSAHRRKRYRKRPYRHPKLLSPDTLPGDVPGVTIIRPLLGLDPNLFYNLQTTLALEYPSDKLEIIFAVQDPSDPALGVVDLLLNERIGGDPSGAKRWAHVDVKVIVNPEVVGTNPKINNLVQPFDEAKFEILWVVDATVSMTSSMLARSVEALITPTGGKNSGHIPSSDKSSAESNGLLGAHVPVEHTAEYSGVGIVHHLPNAWVPNTTGKGTFGSRLEACYLNGVHGRMYLAIVSRLGTRTGKYESTSSPHCHLVCLPERHGAGILRSWKIQHVPQIHHCRPPWAIRRRRTQRPPSLLTLPTGRQPHRTRYHASAEIVTRHDPRPRYGLSRTDDVDPIYRSSGPLDQGQEEDGIWGNTDRAIDRVDRARGGRFVGCQLPFQDPTAMVLPLARVGVDVDGHHGRGGVTRRVHEGSGVGRLATSLGGKGGVGAAGLAQGNAGRRSGGLEIEYV